MFGEMQQWKWVEIPPEDLGPNFLFSLRERVVKLYENKIDVDDGHYCIAVDTESVRLLENPVVQDGTCLALARVAFSSICCRPFKDEVVYCRATKLHEVGILSDFGPVRIFISSQQMKKYKFEPATRKFIHEEDQSEIAENSLLCCRLVGVRTEESDFIKFHALATIDEMDLGPVKYNETRCWIDPKWDQDGRIHERENAYEPGRAAAGQAGAGMHQQNAGQGMNQHHLDANQQKNLFAAQQRGNTNNLGQTGQSARDQFYGTPGNNLDGGVSVGLPMQRDEDREFAENFLTPGGGPMRSEQSHDSSVDNAHQTRSNMLY
ncbi:unnamed protein product [Amoebophrya sp. A120]|nr:unnamed protein product [Amoebophrya sp. A120]|eukprot:GSA120T00024476001.1